MSASDSSFRKAVEFAKKATQNDSDGKYEDALKDYNLCIEYFMHSIKYENPPGVTRDTIMRKIDEYMTRAEAIKGNLDNRKQKVSVSEGDNDDYSKLKKSLERSIAGDVPNVKWDEIIGLEAAKQSLKEAVILPSQFPQLFNEERKPWKGILLFGPPGTGKTQLAKAVATEADNARFLAVSSSDLVSKWMGESEKLIKALFEVARENSPAVIFIDEIDSICASRSDSEQDATRRIKTEILNQMQGARDDSDKVLVLGATNNPWILDSAVRRRFQKRIYIPLPEYNARLKLLQLKLSKITKNFSMENLKNFAAITEGFSGHDIVSAINDANMEPVRRLQGATHFKYVSGPSFKDPSVIQHDLLTPCSPGDQGAMEMSLYRIPSDKLVAPPLTMMDVANALAKAKPSVSREDLVRHQQFMEEFGMSG